MRFSVASFILSLSLSIAVIVTTCATTSHANTRYDCVSPIPPAVPGPLIQPPATPGPLTINEVLLTPHVKWNCLDRNSSSSHVSQDSWVEIYNSGNQAFDLYGSHAALDNGPNTTRSYFPIGAAIAPDSYLVLFPRLFPYFSAAQTRTLRLLISGIVVDEVLIPPLGVDQSYARIPDGSSHWQIVSNPTIDASNSSSTATATSVHSGNKNGNGHTGKSSAGQQNDGPRGASGNNGVSADNRTQPAWSSFHLPTPTATAIALSDTVTSSPPITSINQASDLPRKFFLSLLLILLVLAIFWCWRLFRKT